MECRICTQTFVTIDTLARHQAQEHCRVSLNRSDAEGNPGPIGVPKIGIITDQYSCSTCSQTYTTNSDYELHLLTHLPHRGNLKCTQCDKTFFQNRTLKQHLLHHFRVTDFNCGFCSRKFLTKVSFLNHLPTHAKDKPYECGLCDMKFLLQSLLDIHMKNGIHGNSVK